MKTTNSYAPAVFPFDKNENDFNQKHFGNNIGVKVVILS